MRFPPSRLAAQLQKELAPVYLIFGEEPLQVRESLDAVRGAAREFGFAERVVFEVDAGFDWNALSAETATLSLFATQRLLEVRMPGGKPGKAGERFLDAYCRQPPPGILLLISAGKLDAKARNASWGQAIDKIGVIVQAHPIEVGRLPEWIRQRAAAMGMRIGREAAMFLAQRVEGNLLACYQELEKLQLLYGKGAVDLDLVMAAVFDSSRYNVYTLVDSALAGDRARTATIIQGLRMEGIAPPLILWALGKDLRILYGLSRGAQGGAPPEALFTRYRVWKSRKAILRQALKRHTTRSLLRLLHRLGMVDRVIKGQQPARNPWDELSRLGMALAGGGR